MTGRRLVHRMGAVGLPSGSLTSINERMGHDTGLSRSSTLRRGLLVAVSLLCAACSRPPAVSVADDATVALLTQYEGLQPASRLQLARETEPGERLIVMGRLIRAETGEPIPFHPIVAYQADATGSYDEAVAGLESTARLNGAVETDSIGRFLLSTVLPGDYGSTANNRHIHTTVAGARPEAYDFYFRQYINAGLLRWAEGSRQAVVLDLARRGATLIAAADLPVTRFGAVER